MVVSLVGSVRYGIISLNGENCLGHRFGIMPETSEKAWLCGMGNSGIWNGNCPKVLGFQEKKIKKHVSNYT